MTFQLHECDIYLQRSIGKQTYEVCFRRYLDGHQIENDNLQWANILRKSSCLVDDKDVFAFKDINSW